MQYRTILNQEMHRLNFYKDHQHIGNHYNNTLDSFVHSKIQKDKDWPNKNNLVYVFDLYDLFLR